MAARREGPATPAPPESEAFQRQAELYRLLDNASESRFGSVLHRAIIGMVLVSVCSSVLETVPSLASAYGPLFRLVELATVVFFSIEFVARLWCAPAHPRFRALGPVASRLRYLATPGALIDLLAILPFYLNLIEVIDVRALVVLRLLRFLKLTRYSPGMRSLIEVIRTEQMSLLNCLMFLVGVALISAAFMRWAEQDVQPDKFGSLPDALYWAVITLATVGYGDVVPMTAAGKVIASATALLGLFLLALPIGILASSFAQVIQRRDFVVTWSMVARVPLFDGLPAADIAEIMRYLNSMSVEAGEVVVREGDVAHSMYILASGAVRVELASGTIELREGHFFGEMALLSRGRRSATVRAVTRAKLLVLDAADLNRLMERKPELDAAIRRVAGERAAALSIRESSAGRDA